MKNHGLLKLNAGASKRGHLTQISMTLKWGIRIIFFSYIRSRFSASRRYGRCRRGIIRLKRRATGANNCTRISVSHNWHDDRCCSTAFISLIVCIIRHNPSSPLTLQYEDDYHEIAAYLLPILSYVFYGPTKYFRPSRFFFHRLFCLHSTYLLMIIFNICPHEN